MDHDGVKLHYSFMRLLQVLSQVDGEGKLDELSDFPHGVGKALELEGGHLRNGLKEESFARVGEYFAVFAEILIVALEFVDGEEAIDSLEEGIGSLAFLIYPHFVQC